MFNTGTHDRSLSYSPGFNLIVFKDKISSRTLLLLDQDNRHVMEALPPRAYLAWMEHSGNCRQLSFAIQSIAPFVPDWKISPALHSSLRSNSEIAVSCWHREHLDIAACFQKLGGSVFSHGSVQMSNNAKYAIAHGKLRANKIEALARIPEVRWIYPANPPVPEDELSCIPVISRPFHEHVSPGYFELLGAKKIRWTISKVGVIDTGFDNNSNLNCHPDLRGRLDAILKYPGAPGEDVPGHGTHVAGIIAGNGADSEKDADGFLLGCGLNPQGHLIISNALLANPFPPEGGFRRLADDIADKGASTCNNSWNDGEGVGAGYTANCAVWDAVVRNSGSGVNAGESKGISVIFSAGNMGPDASTITSPKEAKNIVTVGACGTLRSGNRDQLWEQSSRGPCLDGRFAPTLTAPGMSVFSCWTRSGHFSSSGTSSACAHVSGAVAIMTDYLTQYLNCNPSPALVKGLLIQNSERIGENTPDSGWGWGRLSLENFFVNISRTDWIDQSDVLTETGEVKQYTISPLTGNTPVDILLLWTDCPAPPGASPALVNDLDLQVQNAGIIFRGNHFSDGFSIPGGTFDRLNNIERITIAHPSAQLTVQVIAANLIGDGIPDAQPVIDQDFALIVSNAVIFQNELELEFDRNSVACDEVVHLMLKGYSLTDSGTQYVKITSQADQEGIDLALLETPPGSGIFSGDLWNFSGGDARPDSIFVFAEDRIEAVYNSSDSESISASINVFCSPPEIVMFEISEIRADSTRITWQTREPGFGSVLYWEKDSETRKMKRDPWFSRSHSLVLEDLLPCTWYACGVVSTDCSGNTGTLSESPIKSWITDQRIYLYSQNMDSDPEWPVMDDLWEWGRPEGSGEPADPDSGYSGANVIGYNLSGNYQNLIPVSAAASPWICVDTDGEKRLEFFRWLGTENSYFDTASLEIIGDVDSETLWTAPAHTFYDGAWRQIVFDISDQTKNNSEIQIQFLQGPTDPATTSCGWNIDDLAVTVDRPCIPSTPTPSPDFVVPELTLNVNAPIFHPGERLILTAEINNSSNYHSTGLIAVLELVENYYFFPEWTSEFSYEILSVPGKGIFRWILLDFTWPDTVDADLCLTFYSVLFDPQSGNLWNDPVSISCNYIH